MKSSLIPAILLFLAQAASANDSRILGDWVSNCEPNPTGGSSLQFATFKADGTATNTAQDFTSSDCTGPVVQTKVYKVTYTVIGKETDSKIYINMTATPDSIFEGDVVWANYEINFISPKVISAKFIDLIIQVGGVPKQLPAEELAKMPASTWTKK